MKAKISGISYHLPAITEGTSVLKDDNPDWDMPNILDKTGITTRYISANDETAVDLAHVAGLKLFESGVRPEKIDLLILVTQSPDYALPTSACVLQDRLGLPENCMAFDINLGCSGFVYALSVAGSLIESGLVANGMILCSDTYTKYISKDDRTCRPIFSDGASAVLLERSESDTIGPFVFGTDGSGHTDLIVRDSGARGARAGEKRSYGTLEMQGSGVFLFTMRVIPECVNNLLKSSGMTLDDVDLVVFHQASKLVIDNLTRRLSLDARRVFTNYASIGNTVSSTIPIALKDAEMQGRLKNGDKGLVVGFGVGLSWGATLIDWVA